MMVVLKKRYESGRERFVTDREKEGGRKRPLVLASHGWYQPNPSVGDPMEVEAPLRDHPL